jgi:hypothetical protein
MAKEKKVYRTMQGKLIELDLLRARNEMVPAVGNAKLNARGDLIGRGGKVVKTREQIVAEYYNKDKNQE